jgi:hypothetical protein
MPGLLSGSKANSSSPTSFANLSNVQFKLGPTPSTSTGYTLITDQNSVAKFTSSLGNLEFSSGTVYSNLPNQTIQFIGTGTGTVLVSGPQLNTSTSTGALVIDGGIGIAAGLHTGADIYVNGLRIGQGYEGYNNIVLTGTFKEGGQNSPDGESNIAIGYNTLQGMYRSLNSIAIGNNAVSTGTYTVNTIAIGSNSLQNAGTLQSIYVGNIISVTTGTPTIVSVLNHGLSTGTEILIEGVEGTTELNYQHYLINPISPNNLVLYSIYDPNLTTPITTLNPYTTSGTVSRSWVTENNIAIGTYAAAGFYQGVDNFFIGHNAAANFTTGSYNLFIGHEVVGNMRKGNSNISIDGTQLVDGLNGQIGIGSMFYYNGGGYLQLDSNVGLGLGDEATNTTNTGALMVYGGAGISRSLFVGADLNVEGYGTVRLNPEGGGVIIQPTSGGTVTIYPESSFPGNMDNVFIGSFQPRDAVFLNADAELVSVTSTETSTSTTTGALTVAGGVGIRGNMYIGGLKSTSTNYTLYYNTLTNEVTFDIGGTGGGFNGGSQLSSTSTNTFNIFVQEVAPNTLYYPAMADILNDFSLIDADYSFSYDTSDKTLSVTKLNVTSTEASTSTTTGAVTVAGGVGIGGDVYSASGNPTENYLLYTPKITVAASPHSNPRVGDIWIDLGSYAYYQWIDDSGNRFWLQITIL